MAHFAKINENNIVEQVIVIDNMVLFDEDLSQYDERIGADYCNSLIPGKWIQTSYNNKIRKNFAGIGYTWDESRDAFIPPKPYPSWVLNEDQCRWSAPIPYPNNATNDRYYSWNEDILNWDYVLISSGADSIIKELNTVEVSQLNTIDLTILSTTDVQILSTSGI